MNIEITNIRALLQNTQRIVKHQEEIKALRGENFNIFSILRMESKENATHSAFLGELLNPEGSHLLKNKFLQFFLEAVNYKGNLNIARAKLILEYHLGQTDTSKKVGGRIDIYIFDDLGNSISIENKIYADDQLVQIERYVNHNKERNTVYYLTLNGDSASDKSKGELKESVDYFCISYKETIIRWLNNCIKEAAELPILRESIRQYIILINKLTFSMDDKQEKEFNEEIFKNYEISEYVANKFIATRNKLRDNLRKKVTLKIQKLIGDKYELKIGSAITTTYAQIWIWPKTDKKCNTYFGIESFSGTGNFNGDVFIGICRDGGGLSEEECKKLNFNFYSYFWVNVRKFDNFRNENLNLSNPQIMIHLNNDKNYEEELSEHITTAAVDFIKKHDSFIQKNLK